MKRLLSILAAAAVASGLLAMGASAAKKEDAPPAATADQIKKGKADAPAAITAAGLQCTMTNAAWMGSGSQTIDKKKVKGDNYEVACSEGMGYLLSKLENGQAQSYSCIQLASAY